jgi:hypothetical protein
MSTKPLIGDWRGLRLGCMALIGYFASGDVLAAALLQAGGLGLRRALSAAIAPTAGRNETSLLF